MDNPLNGEGGSFGDAGYTAFIFVNQILKMGILLLTKSIVLVYFSHSAKKGYWGGKKGF